MEKKNVYVLTAHYDMSNSSNMSKVIGVYDAYDDALKIMTDYTNTEFDFRKDCDNIKVDRFEMLNRITFHSRGGWNNIDIAITKMEMNTRLD